MRKIFYYVAYPHVCERFPESFLVAQYNPLVRFDFVWRFDVRQLANPDSHNNIKQDI